MELCSNRSNEIKTEPFYLIFKPNFLPPNFPNGEISSCSCVIRRSSNIEIQTVDVRLQYDVVIITHQTTDSLIRHSLIVAHKT